MTFVYKLGWTVAIALCAAHIVFLAGLHSFPFQDVPNHLARGVILADLLFHGGAHYGGQYSVALAPMPYIIHDLILVCAIELLGPHAGMVAFMTLVFLSLPAALLYYMHAARVARADTLVRLSRQPVSVRGLFFSDGLHGISAGPGARAGPSRARGTTARAMVSGPVRCLPAGLIGGYLVHLTVPVFFLGALAISSGVRLLFRASSPRRELWLLVPVLGVLAMHAGFDGIPARSGGSASLRILLGHMVQEGK